MKKRMFQWMCAAILICGAMVFTACSVKDSPVDGETGASGIAMIVKNGQIDYFRQIETAFRDICQEKDLEAYYYATSSESAYEEQLAAVEDLRKLDGKALKGIIFTPSYGLNGESAEAEVAALAQERGIPVIILDSPVSAGSPLASCPYFGTDNTAAGQAMAEEVTADKVAVFATTNSPGIERAEAFKALKPNAVVYQVGDKCNDEVQAVLDEYDTFVFFNGNCLVDAIPMLKAASKQAYTFDIYGEFLDELIAYSPYLKGVMAQNTFSMARKAVEAVLANATQGEMVPTFYITEDNLNDPAVKPFLEFYNKQAPAVIEDLAEKIIGKWIQAEINGEPALTDEKSVTTFVSDTKAFFCGSKNTFTKSESKWNVKREYTVEIDGNNVKLSSKPNEGTTLINAYAIISINDTEFVCKYKHSTLRNGQDTSTEPEQIRRYEKVTSDYSEAVLGTWEGRCTSEGSVFDDGQEHRWQYNADGTYVYYVKDGNNWVPYATNTLNEYFVDGNLLCTRWIDNGVENREWWEITINGNKMNWTALRQKEDGTTFTATFEMTKVE